MNFVQKGQLSGGPEKNATWIWPDPAGGRLKVENYDFSKVAQRPFDNAIACTITVNELDKLLSIIHQGQGWLIPWMAQYFKRYFGIKQWPEESKIGFRVEAKAGP
jgi:hypothetical protein